MLQHAPQQSLLSLKSSVLFPHPTRKTYFHIKKWHTNFYLVYEYFSCIKKEGVTENQKMKDVLTCAGWIVGCRGT